MWSFLAWLEGLGWLGAFRESVFAYPVVEGLHLLGLSIAVGLLALVDFRLAGWLWAAEPAHEVVRSLRPWFVAGFALVIGTGLVLFSANAMVFARSPLFWVKVALVVLAGLNAVYFEFAHRHAHRAVGAAARTPFISSRVAGLVSLGLWIAVIVLGRLLAYFQHNGG